MTADTIFLAPETVDSSTEDQEFISSEKQYLMGRMEEAIFLATIACGGSATAEAVRTMINSRFGDRPMTAILTTLDRLKDKGFLAKNKESETTATPKRKKRFVYSATPDGVDSVSRSLRMMHDLAKEAGLVSNIAA